MAISKYKFLLISLLIIVFISGAVIYYFVGDETAGWKIYRSEVYGFTLKYPQEWEVWSQRFTGDKERRPVTPESVNIVFGSVSIPMTKGEVTIGIRRNEQPETVEGIIESFQGGRGERVILGKQSFVERLFGSKKDEKELTIAARFQNSWENERQEKWSSQLFYIPRGNLTLVLSEVAQMESPSELKIVEQIARSVGFFDTVNVVLWDTVCAFPEFKSFELTIRQGEGATHIARSVLKAYVNAVVLKSPEKQKDFYLLPEEKVYAEDYIVKRLDKSDIYYSGDLVNIPCVLVEEAATKARQLTLIQRGALEEFSQQVPQFEVIQQIRDAIDKTATSGGVAPFIFEVGR